MPAAWRGLLPQVPAGGYPHAVIRPADGLYAVFIPRPANSSGNFMRWAPTSGAQATWDSLHDRFSVDRARRRRDRRDDRLRLALRACVAMAELILGGAVAAFLLIYLIWALVRPEDL